MFELLVRAPILYFIPIIIDPFRELLSLFINRAHCLQFPRSRLTYPRPFNLSQTIIHSVHWPQTA